MIIKFINENSEFAVDEKTLNLETGEIESHAPESNNLWVIVGNIYDNSDDIELLTGYTVV